MFILMHLGMLLEQAEASWSRQQRRGVACNIENHLIHSISVCPAGRPVKDCAFGGAGLGQTFWGPQPARDGPILNRSTTSPLQDGTERDRMTYLTFLGGIERLQKEEGFDVILLFFGMT